MGKMNVVAEVAGVVWKVAAGVGAQVEEDDDIIVLESMKMEIPITAPVDGKIIEVFFEEGEKVGEGETVAVMEV